MFEPLFVIKGIKHINIVLYTNMYTNLVLYIDLHIFGKYLKILAVKFGKVKTKRNFSRIRKQESTGREGFNSPVVEENVRDPYQVRGEAKVLNARVVLLVP